MEQDMKYCVMKKVSIAERKTAILCRRMQRKFCVMSASTNATVERICNSINVY